MSKQASKAIFLTTTLVFFLHRASIVQKRIIYFQDEGSLTKKLCEQGKTEPVGQGQAGGRWPTQDELPAAGMHAIALPEFLWALLPRTALMFNLAVFCG